MVARILPTKYTMTEKRTSFRYAVVLATTLCLSFYCQAALAYKVNKTKQGKAIKWNTNTVTYYVNTDGAPPGSLPAIRAALEAWSNVAASSFRFVYGGPATSTAYNTNDGVNIICFAKMGNKAKVARNYVHWNELGELCDSDIALNIDHKFSAADRCPKNCYDVQNVLTHELGHTLSLGDLYKKSHAEKTMYGRGFKGDTKKRTLERDDMDGIIRLYP